MTDQLLRLRNVTKRFGGVAILDNLSLDIGRGELFTLLGSSGCGKTTTLRIIAGLETPDEGEILLGDQVLVSTQRGIRVPANKRNMGLVFQSYAIWPHKTVFENVAYPLRIRRIPKADIRRRVAATLELVGLGGLEQRPAPTLSGGQQQRVALARALVYEPSVLLLDEPFSNLDAKLREHMRVQLRVLLKQIGVTAIFVTHDQVEALTLSDRIGLMSRGRLEQCGTPQELYEAPASETVRDFLGGTIVLTGTVLQPDGDEGVTIRLDVSEESHIHVQGSEPVGQRVKLTLRPEEVRVTQAAGRTLGANEIAGRIEALLFAGDYYECRIKLTGGEDVLLHLPRPTTLHEQSEVHLQLPSTASIWPG